MGKIAIVRTEWPLHYQFTTKRHFQCTSWHRVRRHISIRSIRQTRARIAHKLRLWPSQLRPQPANPTVAQPKWWYQLLLDRVRRVRVRRVSRMFWSLPSSRPTCGCCVFVSSQASITVTLRERRPPKFPRHTLIGLAALLITTSAWLR